MSVTFTFAAQDDAAPLIGLPCKCKAIAFPEWVLEEHSMHCSYSFEPYEIAQWSSSVAEGDRWLYERASAFIDFVCEHTQYDMNVSNHNAIGILEGLRYAPGGVAMDRDSLHGAVSPEFILQQLSLHGWRLADRYVRGLSELAHAAKGRGVFVGWA